VLRFLLLYLSSVLLRIGSFLLLALLDSNRGSLQRDAQLRNRLVCTVDILQDRILTLSRLLGRQPTNTGTHST